MFKCNIDGPLIGSLVDPIVEQAHAGAVRERSRCVPGRRFAPSSKLQGYTMRSYLLAALVAVGFYSLFPTTAQASGDALAFFQTPGVSSGSTAQPTARSGRPTTSASVEGSVARGGPASDAVAALARQHGVPVSLAMAVCQVESRCRFGLVGRAGERGPLQIKLATARGLGYNGSAAGLNGYAGAYWGMKHLAVAYKKCGTVRGAAKLHNAGLASSCSGSRYTSRVMARM
jgi:soluble lytic murein transglycosylase-like protein